MLNDNDGNIIANIKKDQHEIDDILDKIFHRWSSGEGKSYTWKEFIRCLKYAKLRVLADKLEKRCTRKRPTIDIVEKVSSFLPSSSYALPVCIAVIIGPVLGMLMFYLCGSKGMNVIYICREDRQ